MENHIYRFPFVIRIISIILITAFLAYDISWAYPDKLAAPSFFKDEESIHKVYAKLLEHLIEQNGI